MRSFVSSYIAHILLETELLFSLHRRTAFIIFFVPIVYTLLFGGLFFKNAVTAVPVAVYNLDRGASGRQFVRDLAASPDLRLCEMDGAGQDTVQTMAEKGFTAAVTIPPGFSRHIASGRMTTIELVVDNSNTVLGGVATRAVQEVVSTWDGRIAARQRLAAGWNQNEAQAMLTLRNRIIGNPTPHPPCRPDWGYLCPRAVAGLGSPPPGLSLAPAHRGLSSGQRDGLPGRSPLVPVSLPGFQSGLFRNCGPWALGMDGPADGSLYFGHPGVFFVHGILGRAAGTSHNLCLVLCHAVGVVYRCHLAAPFHECGELAPFLSGSRRLCCRRYAAVSGPGQCSGLGDSRHGYYGRHGLFRVMAVKIGLYWLCSFLSVLSGIGILIGLFRLPLYGNLGAVLLLCGAFLFAVENMAGLLALYFRTKLTLTQFLVFYSLPAFLISGYIWPEQAMPGIIRFLAWLQPLHYAMVDFRQLALTGQSATWGIHACLLAGAGVIAAFFTLKYVK